jgi:hypothetical protein
VGQPYQVDSNVLNGQVSSRADHSLYRLGGADGTNLQTANCMAGTVSPNCMAAFLALHLTKRSSAYLEVCLLVSYRMISSLSGNMQGTWVWLADHDMDGNGATQLSLFSGRGVFSESKGPVWMIGTASEHHTMYEYSLVGAKDHWMGFIQTETVSITPVFKRGSHTAPRSLIISLSRFLQRPLRPIESIATQPLATISRQHGVSMCKRA